MPCLSTPRSSLPRVPLFRFLANSTPICAYICGSLPQTGASGMMKIIN